MRKPTADCERGLSTGMSGDQVIGLDSSTFHCGELLEEGLKLLQDYRDLPPENRPKSRRNKES